MEGAAAAASAERAGPLSTGDDLPATVAAGAETAPQATLRPDRTLAPSEASLSMLVDGQALEMGGVLGRGGMATVFEARQVALGRSVAVKVPNGELASPRISAMLAEAVVTGQLEHPGIVPVHTLEIDDDGRPRLVLKRIEGQSWADLLSRQNPAQRTDAELAEHLRILLRVSEALAFAHSRGIVHRDIKPENVMVGRFGEVYLLDWGIAVTLRDDADPRIPRLDGESGVAGTPHYMAPEQAADQRDEIGPRTDVFLLGATLYEVLTGQPPYRGRTALALLTAASRGLIAPVPDFVDPRLAAICLGAMAHRADERPPSTTEWARRVEAWLDQRPALRLLDESSSRVETLEAAAAGEVQLDRLTLEATFDGVRSALAQVASLLPAGTVDALRGRAAVAMARVALADGDAEAARVRLTLPGAAIDPQVRIELNAAISARRLEDARRASDAARMDSDVGRRMRGWAALLLGIGWVVLPLSEAILGAISPLNVVARNNALLGVVVLAIFALRWKHLGRTVPNRLLLLCWMVVTFGFGLFAYWGHLQGLEPELLYTQQLFIVAIVAAVYAVGVEQRAWPIIPATLAMTVLAGLMPERVMAVTAANNLMIVTTLVYTAFGRRRANAG